MQFRSKVSPRLIYFSLIEDDSAEVAAAINTGSGPGGVAQTSDNEPVGSADDVTSVEAESGAEITEATEQQPAQSVSGGQLAVVDGASGFNTPTANRLIDNVFKTPSLTATPGSRARGW